MKTIEVGNQLTITPMTPALVEWTARHLIVENPEYIKRERLNLWTGGTAKTIDLYKIKGNSLVLPYGVLKQILPVLKDYKLVSQFKPQPDIDYGGQDVPLYDYQQKAVTESVKAKLGILRSAAGSGKTQMGIAMVKRFGKRALWLTHTKDLLNQSRDRALRYIDPSMIGEIGDGKVKIGEGITFATIQTMVNLDLTELIDYWDVIICDECHRISGSPSTMTMFYKVLNNLRARHKYGLSATVHRSDGMIVETKALLGDICYSVPDEAVRDKIMKVTISPVSTPVMESRDYRGYDGMLTYGKLLTYLCEHEDRNQLIVNFIIGNNDKSCLVLSDRLTHLQILQAALPDWLKPKSCLVTGKTKKETREQAISDMRSGEKTILFATYSLAKEGLDIPILSRLFLVTPHKDYAVITQSIGRIARICEGKPNPVCYDFVDGNIRQMWNAYKTRCTSYRKNGCEIE